MTPVRLAAHATLATLAASTFARDAAARGEGGEGLQALPATGWYLPVGINAGVAGIGSHDVGAILGGEASVARLTGHTQWFGVYADGGYMTNGRALRFSGGPEAGLGFIGIDGGFLDVVESGHNLVGFTVRPLLTIGFLAVYGRWDHTFSSGGQDTGQIGVLVKWPIPLEGQHL